MVPPAQKQKTFFELNNSENRNLFRQKFSYQWIPRLTALSQSSMSSSSLSFKNTQ